MLTRCCRGGVGCHGAMLHSVAPAVAAAVLLIRNLSAWRGLRRSDAAGTAQCGSGEAALCLLPVLSPSLSFLICPSPFHLPLSPFFCHLTLPFSLSSPFRSSFGSSPVPPLSPLCHIWWFHRAVWLDKLHRGFCYFWIQ